jgi:hypothetical protein
MGTKVAGLTVGAIPGLTTAQISGMTTTMTNALLTILGSGTSTGVPVPGCTCSVCTSGKERNQRTRTSAYVSIGGKHLIIDTSSDFRAQFPDFTKTLLGQN